jgi:hypothetical protein
MSLCCVEGGVGPRRSDGLDEKREFTVACGGLAPNMLCCAKYTGLRRERNRERERARESK